MRSKTKTPSHTPEQGTAGPGQQQHSETATSNAQTAATLQMPPALPYLGFEILDLLDRSLGESEVDLGPIDHSGNSVAAEPTCQPNGAPTPPVDPASCPPIAPADAAILQELADLLTYSSYTDRVTHNEISRAQGLVGALSPCAYEQFLELRGGVLADRLLSNPEGEGWQSNVIGNVADNPQGLADAALAWWQGDSALEVAQAGMGGSIDGVTLDTAAPNTMGVSTDLARSKLTVSIPNLSIASIRYAADGALVTSGPGTVIQSSVVLDLPDNGSSNLMASVDIHRIDWTGLQVATDAITATIPQVVLASVNLAAVQASLDPQVVARATVAPALARAAMTTAMSKVLLPHYNKLSLLMAPLMLGATKPAQDAEVGIREAFELGDVDALDVSLSIKSIDLPRGASVTSRTSDGASSTTQVDSLHIEGLKVALLQVDRLDALENEAYNLSSQMDPLDPLDQIRLDSIHAQIAELTPKAERRAALEQAAQAGSITTAETTELLLLTRDLSAGLMRVTMDTLDVHGVSTNGTALDDVTVMDLDVTVMGNALAYRRQDHATVQEASDARRASLDALVARQANAPILPAPSASDAPLWSLPEGMEDIGFVGTAGLVEAGGVDTQYGDTDRAAASFMDFRGDANVIGIQATDMQADDLDAMGLTADHLQGGSADIRVRGNDIGGSIQRASGEGIHYAGSGLSADMQTGSAQSIHFDADAGEQRLRSGTIAEGRATGLEYTDAGQRVVAQSASAETLAARGATSAGVDELTVAKGSAQDGSYERHAAPASVGLDGQAIDAVTGMDARFDSARIADLRVRDATTAGTGTMDLASLDAEGVSGGMDRMGTASADVVSLRTLNASRDEDGVLSASIREAAAGGVIGQMPGTAYASADSVAIHDITAGGDASGNYSAQAESGSVEGVHVLAPQRAEGTVDSIDLAGLHGDMQSDGSLSAGADLTTATGIAGDARGYGQGTVETLTLNDAEGHLNADGSGGASTSSGEILGIDGSYGESADPTATGHVDRVGFGYAGVNVDEEYNVTGAEVNDLDGAGISIELLKLPMDEAGDAPEGPSAVAAAAGAAVAGVAGSLPGGVAMAAVETATGVAAASMESPDRFTADAIRGMSGEVHVDIPTSLGPPLRLSATAVDGRVALRDVRARILGRNNILTTTAQIDAGRGLVIGIGPASMYCVFDERDYAGLISAREGGGRRGSIDVAAFAEGIQNGTVEYDDSGNENLDDRRDDRQARREERDTAAAEQAAERAPRVAARQAQKAKRRAARRERRGLEPELPTVYEGEEGSIQRMMSEYSDDIEIRALGITFLRLYPSQSSVHGTSFDLGSGAIGYDSMRANLADTNDDTFEISGTLDSSLTVGSQELLADSLAIRDALGAPTTLTRAGLRGLMVTIDHPLASDRTITTTIEGGTIRRIVYGEGAQRED